MFLITEMIQLNIFKNCSAVKLTWELSFYKYTRFLPTGWHIATHEMIPLL
jgi:hypothetical protein